MGGDESNAVLTGHDFSSLVIDALCDRAREQDFAVTCFYWDFIAQNEQSPTSMLGAILKQVVSGLKEMPEEIMQAFENQKQAATP